MRAKLTLLSAFAVGIVGGVLVSACQTYDFEPVEPLALAQTTVLTTVTAKSLKPNLMVLLDTSGSMTLPVNTSLAACKDPNATAPNNLCGQPGNIPCNTSQCPTRWSELQGAMSAFLNTSGSGARMGLTTYPQPTGGTIEGQCAASTQVRINIPQVDDTDTANLQKSATDIGNVILSIPNSGTGQPSGGTPTSSSLRFVGTLPDLQAEDREDFVLLLTDGLPNCNANNPNAFSTSPDLCRCTLSACTGSADKRGCLDKDASVSAVSELRGPVDKPPRIRTIVIGFGAETASGSGPETLNAMAEAGGFARNCKGDPNACGAGDTCDTSTQEKLCGRKFYQAANQAELSKALRDIIDRVGSTDPCLLPLDATQVPVDENGNPDKRLIIVYVDTQPVASGPDTWDLTAPGVKPSGVRFLGSTCDRILNSTTANPIKLEVRAVQKK